MSSRNVHENSIRQRLIDERSTEFEKHQLAREIFQNNKVFIKEAKYESNYYYIIIM